ncbi:MAG: class I SAM-dependent methyltransferase [Solirubrobacteraceae bacterium]
MLDRREALAVAARAVADFYDGLAADYHLVWEDRWDEAVQWQGGALDELIRSRRPQANAVLDCSCGIGTQAIGLSLHGYRVHGTDISEASIERARVEAARLGADVSFGVADFRDLGDVSGEFDVVISCDNALPHLLDDDDLLKAFRSMRSKLSPGGLLLISTRDFDRALVDRPSAPVIQAVAGPPRRLIVRLHDWDAPDSSLYTVRFLILTETATGWTLAEHSTRYRAVPSEALAEAARQAGFSQPSWISATGAGYHQPVMLAERPDH